MIKITLPNGEHKLFANYNDICGHINNLERPKTLDSGEIGWRFVRRRYETLSSLYYHNPSLKDFLTPKEKEAVEKEVGLIEIVKGNRGNITQMLFNSRLDTEPLKKNWCHEYCKEHGLEISEWVLKK